MDRPNPRPPKIQLCRKVSGRIMTILINSDEWASKDGKWE
jgi:hypothetical protein